MNEKAKAEKITRFLADQAMSNAVKDTLLMAFLKPKKEADVQYLAASRIAIDLLEEGWKDLAKFQSPNRDRSPSPAQPGM